MSSDPTTIVFQIAILAFSVILHELAHGYAANYYGDPTARLAGRLTLNPISHIDMFGSIILPGLMAMLPGGIIFGWAKPVPYNPYNLKGKFAETVVTGAGVATNLLLALIFGLIIRFFGAELSPAFLDLASYVVIINIVLAIFNAIPIPPLDGSKVLFSLLSVKFYDLQRKLEQWGFFVLIIFIFTLWPLLSPLILGLFKLITGVPVI